MFPERACGPAHRNVGDYVGRGALAAGRGVGFDHEGRPGIVIGAGRFTGTDEDIVLVCVRTQRDRIAACSTIDIVHARADVDRVATAAAENKIIAVIAGEHVVASTTDEAVAPFRSEEHTSELQSLMRISYAVFCLKTKKTHRTT